MSLSPKSAPPSGARPHPTLTGFYTADRERAGFVRELFDESAPFYNGISSALSFGSDAAYRRRALAKAGLRPGLRLLDVASGTGLVAAAALGLGLAPGEIAGLDPSPGMLAQNKARVGVPLVRGLGESLPFAAGSFDFVTMGYALRHVEDLGRLFVEFRRVLKPGGRVLVLEISRPESGWMANLLAFHLGGLIPLGLRCLGLGRPARLMEYYSETIAKCVPPEDIVRALERAGFTSVERRRCGPVLNDFYAEKPNLG